MRDKGFDHFVKDFLMTKRMASALGLVLLLVVVSACDSAECQQAREQLKQAQDAAASVEITYEQLRDLLDKMQAVEASCGAAQ